MSTTPAATKPRQTKTDKQRAEERLGIEERRVAATDKVVKKLRDQLEEAIAEHASATERRDYARKDPALKHAPAGPTSTAPATVPAGATP